jgi:hypothetical protein
MAPLLSTLILLSPGLLAALGAGRLAFSGLQVAAAVVQGGRFAWLYDEDGAPRAVLGGMLWSIFNSLADKLGEYNDAL